MNGRIPLWLRAVGGSALVIALLVWGFISARPNEAQRAACRGLNGSISFFVEKDGDAPCEFPTERQKCQGPGYDFTGGPLFSRQATDRGTCTVEFRRNGSRDTD